MKNLFEISPEENNRIKTLHENYKIVHGTTSLLNEQATDRTLKGVLLDSGNKEPITGANIYVTKDTKKGTTSDSQGKFELKGIKPGESVTISFIGYKTNIINNTTIDTKTGVATEYFLEMGNEVGEVEVKAEREKFAGCMDPKAKNYNPKAWIDCKGKEFNDAKYSVKDGESEIALPTSGDYDTSCCEYYEGCLDKDSKNYYKNSGGSLSEDQLERNFKLQKAFAIAQAVINTALAVSDVLAREKGGLIKKSVAAVAIGVLGAAQVAAIASTKFVPTATSAPSGAAGISGGSSAPAQQEPVFNIVGTGTQMQLAETVAQRTGEPVKAYVVSNDVSTAQELDRNIITGSAIG